MQQNVLHPQQIAALLRWYQLPMLSEQWCSHLQRFVCSNGSAVLPVWLSDDTSPFGLHWTVCDDRWFSVIRTLFKNWRPSDMASRKLVARFGGSTEAIDELVLKTSWRLLRIDPSLMGKIVRLYYRNVCVPMLGVVSARKLLRTLIAAFAESTLGNDFEVQQRKAQLLEDVSNTMGNTYIDTHFIKRGLLEPALRSFQGNKITALEENNIALALNIDPFRRLLGIRILENIEQS